MLSFAAAAFSLKAWDRALLFALDRDQEKGGVLDVVMDNVEEDRAHDARWFRMVGPSWGGSASREAFRSRGDVVASALELGRGHGLVGERLNGWRPRLSFLAFPSMC